jgi:Flp pilus assembly pilin Flp
VLILGGMSVRSTRHACSRGGRDERGAAAVEAGLITALLSPLLLGLLGMGNLLWGLQDTHAYEPRVDQAQVAGSFLDCQSLLRAVKDSVLVNADNLGGSTDLALDDITAEVVDFVPDQIGVDVHVAVRVASRGALGWLPFKTDTLLESQLHLDYAVLDVETC